MTYLVSLKIHLISLLKQTVDEENVEIWFMLGTVWSRWYRVYLSEVRAVSNARSNWMYSVNIEWSIMHNQTQVLMQAAPFRCFCRGYTQRPFGGLFFSWMHFMLTENLSCMQISRTGNLTASKAFKSQSTLPKKRKEFPVDNNDAFLNISLLT